MTKLTKHIITLYNILSNLLIKRRFSVIFKKILNKYGDDISINSQVDNINWIKSNISNFHTYAKNINQTLWEEAEEVSKDIELHAKNILNSQDVKFGGGGIYPFLYFLTRVLRPKNALETGVASGYSSLAILLAMNKNQKGKLYSSDFPYFREKDAENYIGVLVHDYLKSRWILSINGDEKNLKSFFKRVNTFDFAHYDSDKSYKGRSFFMSSIVSKMTKDPVILMDDIQDNPFFMDYVLSNNIENWSIFKFEGKYIGMIGAIKQSNLS